MKVADILRIKGSVVKTVPPHETALLLSGQMRAEQIGALVVSSDGNSIEGIVSERDLAYGLATYGGRLPTIPVSQLMTKAPAPASLPLSIFGPNGLAREVAFENLARAGRIASSGESFLICAASSGTHRRETNEDRCPWLLTRFRCRLWHYPHTSTGQS